MEARLDALTPWYGLGIVGLFLALAGLEVVRGRDGSVSRLAANVGCWLLGAWAASFLPDAGGLAGNGVSVFAWVHDTAGAGTVLVTGLVALDLFAYASHRLHHRVHMLWRFHAVHHADQIVDASTGLRHHPGEALSGALLGGVVFGLLGLPAWALAACAAAMVAWALLLHADLVWPPALERVASHVLVTPPLHRIHHSEDARHHGTNFGEVLCIWDRLFGTYHPPTDQPLHYGIGPAGARASNLPGALMLPLHLRAPGRVEAKT